MKLPPLNWSECANIATTVKSDACEDNVDAVLFGRNTATLSLNIYSHYHCYNFSCYFIHFVTLMK